MLAQIGCAQEPRYRYSVIHGPRRSRRGPRRFARKPLAVSDADERKHNTGRRPLHGFVSYAHEDRHMVNRLRTHLTQTTREGLVDAFRSDESLAAGDVWSEHLANQIAGADLFLICLSAAYIASEFRDRFETPRIRHREDEVNALIIPVVLRDCAWWGFADNLQVVPTVRGHIRPISAWKPAESGYAQAAAQIHAAIKVHMGLVPRPVAPPHIPVKTPKLSYDGPHRLSDEAIDRAVRGVFGRYTTAK